MVPFIALVLASTSAPVAGMSAPALSGPGTLTSARASARILPSVTVRQGQAIDASGPQVQINRQSDGTMLVEFT